MFFATKDGQQKRRAFRAALDTGRLLSFPGAFSPLVAMMIEQTGFDGVYISGAVLSNDLGMPDIGLTTLSEVAARGRVIARATDLPAIIDMDTGFGEAINAARTVRELEAFGLCGGHLEDQVLPKRCGHLDNKTLVDIPTMVNKIKAAVRARTDSNFILIARTDSRAVEGFEQAVERSKAYVDAGADMIFPEALTGPHEFEKFKEQVPVPLLANMTEFGKSELLTRKQLEDLGYNIVIYPVTTLRLALKAVEDGLRSIRNQGTQADLLDSMLTRKRLYEILEYQKYNEFDEGIYNFKM